MEFEGDVQTPWVQPPISDNLPYHTIHLDPGKILARIGFFWKTSGTGGAELEGLRFSYSAEGDFEVVESWNVASQSDIHREWYDAIIPEGLQIVGFYAQPWDLRDYWDGWDCEHITVIDI